MLTDASLLFSSAQAITTTAVSTNVADLGVVNDPGIGEWPLNFAIYVGTAFAGGTSLQVQVQGSVDNSTFKVISQTDAILTATLVANNKIPISLTHRGDGMALYRYLRLNYVVVGTMSAGTLNAYLVIERDDWSMGFYPNGYVVGS